MMQRRPSNRADIEANDVVEDPVMRCCKRVVIIIIVTVILVTLSVALGLYVAYLFSKDEDKEYYRTHYFTPIIFGVLSLLIMSLGIFLMLRIDLRAVRSDLRRCYRNLRRIMRLIRMPAFCTRYLRGLAPHRGVRVNVNTITVRPEPTPQYAVADCAVQIETPSAFNTIYEYAQYHLDQVNRNVPHQD